ncbi:hypothetical protein ES703_125742 [subsurface metagenome]
MTPLSEQAPALWFTGLCCLIGQEYYDWIFQLAVFDEYTDPDYCHQN